MSVPAPSLSGTFSCKDGYGIQLVYLRRDAAGKNVGLQVVCSKGSTQEILPIIGQSGVDSIAAPFENGSFRSDIPNVTFDKSTSCGPGQRYSTLQYNLDPSKTILVPQNCINDDIMPGVFVGGPVQSQPKPAMSRTMLIFFFFIMLVFVLVMFKDTLIKNIFH